MFLQFFLEIKFESIQEIFNKSPLTLENEPYSWVLFMEEKEYEARLSMKYIHVYSLGSIIYCQ